MFYYVFFIILFDIIQSEDRNISDLDVVEWCLLDRKAGARDMLIEVYSHL